MVNLWKYKQSSNYYKLAHHAEKKSQCAMCGNEIFKHFESEEAQKQSSHGQISTNWLTRRCAPPSNQTGLIHHTETALEGSEQTKKRGKVVCTVAQRIHHGVKLAPNWAETKVEKTERPAAGSQEDAASENSCRWMISKVDKLTVGQQGNIDKSFCFMMFFFKTGN